MNYDEFRSAIYDSLRDAFPVNTGFESTTIVKNNDHKKDAIIITMPGSQVSPTIYPENYYGMYESGHTVEYITSQILDGCINSFDLSFPSSDLFYDMDYVRDRITFRLINAPMNKELLKGVPYVPYLDLAIVFFLLIDSNDDLLSGFMIHDSHAAQWDLTTDELYSLALKNTPGLLPIKLSNISEFLCAHMEEHQDIADVLDYTSDYDLPMYIMSNEHNVSGAATLLYPDAISSFAKKEGSDILILPSSIHEVILVPMSPGLTADYINEMIAAGNSTLSNPEEILSDHYYYYCLDRNEVIMP